MSFHNGVLRVRNSVRCWSVLRALLLAALAVPFLSVLIVGNLYAQVEKATLSGTVTDASGAVVVGAKVQAKNVSTGVTYSGDTDGQGRYILAEMQVGTYEVSAQKSGFQEMVQTGVVLSVGARPILDFKLPVGRAEQIIEVQGEASRVDTETAAVGQLVSSSQMENLPINGRNFASLITLAPGVASVPPSPGGGGQSSTVYGNQTNYSVAGSRPVGMAYMLDNTDIRDWLDHGAGVSIMGTSLGMEAIQEFSVLTNTYSAEFGGTGAAVNAVTKSGTNSLHGSLYEYVRNSALDSMNYFDVPGHKPSFSRNQFGGSLGGPIKTDKAFFFVNYEGLRATSATTTRAVVPTSLPDLYKAGGMTQDEETGQWSGPYGPLNPVSGSIFGLYPAAQSLSDCPNVTDLNLFAGTGLYCSANPQTGNEDYGLARVDYIFSPQDSLFARYAIENAYQLVPYSYSPVPGYPEADFERNQYFTIEERHTFSPKLLNEARFGYVRLFTQTSNPGAASNSGPLVQNAGRQGMDFIPGWGLSSIGPPPSSPSRPVVDRFSVGDDVVMSRGAHSIRFGATVTIPQLNQLWNQYSGGAWIFANLSGLFGPGLGGSLYGNPLLCVCAAAPSYAYTTPGGTAYPFSDSAHWRQTWVDPYIQDDWKITSRLTLNIGLRYAWASNPTMVGHQPIFVIPNLTSPATTEFDFVTAHHPFTNNPNKLNFDPRIGLAWDPFGDHKTSVRAGFGMFHEPVTARTYALDNTSMRPNEPLFFLFFTEGVFPNLPTSPSQIINIATPPFAVTAASQIAWYYGILQNVDTSPYVMQYNLNVQRELGHGTVLSVGYSGSQGDHLFFWIDANPPQAFSDLTPAAQATALATGNYPSATGAGTRGTLTNPFMGTHVNPNFAAFEAVEPRAHSTYNSLQITLNRQFAKSLVGNVGYTWSKCLDNASATISTEQGEWAVVDSYNPGLDRGPCSFSSNNVFAANAIYRLPFKGNRWVEGWQVSPIVSYSTGLPFNVQNSFGGQYQSQTGGATEGERPERLPGCKAMVRKRTEWWNPECFVFAPYGTLGNSGRDSLNNPNFSNIDFAIFKDTRLNEKLTVQLRAEFFDILNHANFLVGPQAYLMSVANLVTPTLASPPAAPDTPNPNYSQLSNPAAYELPSAAHPTGGVFCNPSQVVGTPLVGPCYLPTTALGLTAPGDKGGQRQIQFAVRFMF
ncbi:MAG TPA: carboxypeptidase regulatory-like domain-containing protein [Candidatus Acidoferrales bacterium]|nr:carboxypeptidase regulatory-like domain-containing protein [Candidatus Acidoferrales bacterium]